MNNIRLTERVHETLSEFITAGDSVVDATAGNGYDTLFLAEQVGDKGRVYAIDIQQRAVDSARQLVQDAGLEHRVEWFCASHAELGKLIAPEYQQTIKAVVFNLGYLPGSDKSIQTKAATTLSALSQAYALLSPGGALSVMAYPGHAGGEQETKAVKDWFDSLTINYTLLIPDSQHATAPHWFWLVKSPQD